MSSNCNLALKSIFIQVILTLNLQRHRLSRQSCSSFWLQYQGNSSRLTLFTPSRFTRSQTNSPVCCSVPESTSDGVPRAGVWLRSRRTSHDITAIDCETYPFTVHYRALSVFCRNLFSHSVPLASLLVILADWRGPVRARLRWESRARLRFGCTRLA